MARVRRRASHPRPLVAPVRRLRRHDRARGVRRVGLRGRRAALPAGRALDRPRRRRGRARRVPVARVRGLLPARAAPPRAADRGTAERAARGGLSAPDRAGLRGWRAARRGAVPGGDRRAGDRPGVPAGAPRGTGPVGAGGRARGRAEPPAPRLQHGRVPRAAGSRRAHGRDAARGAAVDTRPVAGRGCLLRPPRGAPLARHEVRGRRRGDRRVRRAGDLARAAPDARDRRRGGGALLRRPVRGDQRGDLQRTHSIRRRDAPARRPPTPGSPVDTSGGPTGSWRCSSTAATASSAGRRCSCSRSPACGGCGGRAATGWLGRYPACATWSSPRGCAPRRSGRSCSWPRSWRPRCSASGSRRAI